MLATSEGDLLGRALFTWLKDRDQELTVLTRSLQQQKVKLSTNRRYRSLNNRIRSYTKNEINRVLNRLLETYDIKSLTVENLDFRFGGLSKTLNRIISRAGRAAVNLKLQSLQEVDGVTVHKVNPAYTSQQCSGCGHVDKRNRTGPAFKCRFCHKSLSADVNAARNVLSRRSTGMTSLMSARSTVLLAQDHVFEHKWGLIPGSAQRLRDLRVQQPVIPTVSTVDLSGTGNLFSSLVTASLVSS